MNDIFSVRTKQKYGKAAGIADGIFRALVVFVSVLGMSMILNDCLLTEVSLAEQIKTAGIITALFAFISEKPKLSLIPIGIVAAFFAAEVYIFKTKELSFPADAVFNGVMVLWNRLMDRIALMGYVPLDKILLPVSGNYAGTYGDGILAADLFTAAVFTWSMRRKPKIALYIVPPILLFTPPLVFSMPSEVVPWMVFGCGAAGAMAVNAADYRRFDKKETRYVGFSGIAVMLCIALSCIYPLSTADKEVKGIPIISAAVERARQGIEDFINGGGQAQQSSHEVTPSKRTDSKKVVMTVESDSGRPLYLASWYGQGYIDDHWEGTKATVWWEELICAIEDSLPGDKLESLGVLGRTTIISPVGLKKGDSLFLPSTCDGRNALLSDRIIYGDIFERSGENVIMTKEIDDPVVIASSLHYTKTESGAANRSSFALRLLNSEPYDFEVPDAEKWLAAYIKGEQNAFDLYTEILSLDAVYQVISDMFENTKLGLYYNAFQISDRTNGVSSVGNIRKDGVLYVLQTEKTASGLQIPLDTEQIVSIVADYLSENYKYSKNPKKLKDGDPIANFLLETKEGYCVQFATAATLILRSLGLPTRYCEGYLAKDFVRGSNGKYTCDVLEKNGHAWVEVWVPAFGWIPYEVTGGGFIHDVASLDTEEPDITTSADTAADTTAESKDTKGTETTSADTENAGGTEKKNVGAVLTVFGAVILTGAAVYAYIKTYRARKQKKEKILRKPQKYEKELRKLFRRELKMHGIRGKNILPSEYARMLGGEFPGFDCGSIVSCLEKEFYDRPMSGEELGTVAEFCSYLEKQPLEWYKKLLYRGLLMW